MLENLRWVMESPSLLEGSSNPAIISDAECRQWFAEALPKLLELGSDPSSIEAFLTIHRKSGRLGNLFEALLQFWLERLLGVKDLAQGIPIREGGETRGELDFVFRWPDGRTEHWEAAVKFFMCVAPTPELAVHADTFVGQALVDRLDRKLELSLRKQLPLAQHPRAQEILRQLGFSGEVRSRLFFKGRLFYPLSWNRREVQGPAEVSPCHERGWWLAWNGAESLSQLLELTRRSVDGGVRHAWMILGKERWMGRVTEPAGSAELLGHEQLAWKLDTHFAARTDAVQIALLEQREDGSWREPRFDSGIGRGMLLQPGWPHSVTKT